MSKLLFKKSKEVKKEESVMRKELKLKFNFIMYNSKFEITIAKENLSLRRYSDLVWDYLYSVIKRNGKNEECYVYSQSKVTDSNSKNFCYYLNYDGEKYVNRYVYCEELEKYVTFSIDIVDVGNILSQSQIFSIIKYVSKNINTFNDILNYSSESEVIIEANNIYKPLQEYENQINRSLQIYKVLHCDMDNLAIEKNEGNIENHNWNSYILNSYSSIFNSNVLGYYFKTNINNGYVIVFKVINNKGILSNDIIYELLHILSVKMVGRE